MKYRMVKTLLAMSIVLPITVSALELTAQQMTNVTLSTTTITNREAASNVLVNGVLRADQQRLFRVSPVVDGFVTKLNVVSQTTVRKGQVLAKLRSNTLGQAQTNYLETLARFDVAKADYQRIKGLSSDGVVSASRLLASQSKYKMADASLDQRRRELTLAGMSNAQIKRLTQEPDNIADYPLLSSANGMLLEVSIENGQMLAAGESAFRIIDLSVLWAEVKIPVSQLTNIKLGTTVKISVAAYPQRSFGGRLESLSGEVDMNSQTLSGRVVINNNEKQLRPGMHVQAKLQGQMKSGLMVPSTAVFRSGNDNYVFVVTGPRNFEPIKVTTSNASDTWIKIESGVSVGDVVVNGGVAELKSHWQYQGGE